MSKNFIKFIEGREEIVELHIVELIAKTLKDLDKEVVYSDVERRFYLYQDGFWNPAEKDYVISVFWSTYSSQIFPKLVRISKSYILDIVKANKAKDQKKAEELSRRGERIKFFIKLTQKKAKEYLESLSMCCKRIPDTNYSKIPLKNGYIDVEDNFSFHPPTPYIYNRYVLDFKYIEDLKGEPITFFKFLKQILPTEEDREFLLNWMAHMLIIGNHRQKALFLYGSGRNGKGVLSRILHRLLGTQNCSTLTVKQLSGEKYFLSQLNNKLANICPDSDDKDAIDIGTFKTVTGNDTITVRDIYNAPFSMIYQGKLIYSINKVPYFSSKDVAIMERVEILNFPVTIKENARIPNLEEIILKKEGDLIFNYLLKRLKYLKKIDFKFVAPRSVKNFTAEIMDEQDNISSFLVEYLIDNKDETRWSIGLSIFYNQYKEHAQEGGYKVLNRTNFKDTVQKWAQRRKDISITYGTNGKNYVFSFQRMESTIPLVIEDQNGAVLEEKKLKATYSLMDENDDVPY